MKRANLLAMGLGASLLLSASGAFAQHGRVSHAEFDRLVRSATTHYEAHESAAAIQDLERAYALRPTPRVLYNLGRAHEQAGHFSIAVDYYGRFLASSPDPQSAQVAREAQTVAQRHMDEEAAASRQAQSEREAAERRAATERAEAERVRLAREQAQQGPHPRAPRRVTTATAVLWTTAGVGLAASAVLGGLALSTQAQWRSTHQGADRADLADRGGNLALGADIAAGTAILAGVVGIIVYLVQPRPEVVVTP